MRGILLCLLGLCARRAAQSLRVRSGESIAAALELATPGTVVEVEPGIYHEALVVDTPNVTLRGIVRGAERPVLDGRGALNDGVIASGSPFTMTGFAVRHYKGNGVSTQGVDGVFLTDLVIDDTGLYGVYPVQSRNISITHCTAHRDAAIYVGESQGALVAMNYVTTTWRASRSRTPTTPRCATTSRTTTPPASWSSCCPARCARQACARACTATGW
jgi:nitrous oxidase accessory protein NosD